jgi:hypothetical protein
MSHEDWVRDRMVTSAMVTKTSNNPAQAATRPIPTTNLSSAVALRVRRSIVTL